MADVDGPSIQGCFPVFRCYISYPVPTFLIFIFFNVAIGTSFIISILIAVNKLSIFFPKQNCIAEISGRKSYLPEVYVWDSTKTKENILPEFQFPSYFTTNSYHHWDWLTLQIWAPEGCFKHCTQRHRKSKPCTTEQVVCTCPNGT